MLLLADNVFTGNLPPEIGKLVNLSKYLWARLYLAFVKCNASHECSFWLYIATAHVVLRNNGFVGELTSQLLPLSSLQDIDVGKNGFSGNIFQILGGTADKLSKDVSSFLYSKMLMFKSHL
jgi:hypothetical protein